MPSVNEILVKASSMAEGVKTPAEARIALKSIAIILEQDTRLAPASASLRQIAGANDDKKVLAECRVCVGNFREWAARSGQGESSRAPVGNTGQAAARSGFQECSKEAMTPKGDASSPKATGYGLSVYEPVLCGGGPTVEHDYLRRLRCPAGRRVKFQREGSDALEAKPAYISSPHVRFDPGSDAIAKGASQEMVCSPLHIDAYRVTCGCGKHAELVWIDMYHRGPEKVIGARGWKLESDDGPSLSFPVIWVFKTAERLSKCSTPERLPAALHEEWKAHLKLKNAGSFWGSTLIIDSSGQGFTADTVLAEPVKKRLLFLFPYTSTHYRIVGMKPTRKYSVDKIKLLMLHRIKNVVADTLFGGAEPSQKERDEARQMLQDVANAKSVRGAIDVYPFHA